MTRVELWELSREPRDVSYDERDCEFIAAWEDGEWADPMFEGYPSDVSDDASHEEIVEMLFRLHKRPPIVAFDGDNRPGYLEQHAAEQVGTDR